jgi:hypothetical protein
MKQLNLLPVTSFLFASQNQNAHFPKSKTTRTRKLLFMLAAVVALQFYATAQTRFTRSTFNAAFVPITLAEAQLRQQLTGDNANQVSITTWLFVWLCRQHVYINWFKYQRVYLV